MNKQIYRTKKSLIIKIVKILFWLLLIAGLILTSIGIYKFIDSVFAINQSLIDLETITTPELGYKAFEDLSGLIKNANINLTLFIIGVLIMIFSRIVSKPPLIIVSIFVWIVEKDENYKRNFKKKAIVGTIFLTISLICAIMTLVGFVWILTPFTAIISDVQKIVDTSLIEINNNSATMTPDQLFEIIETSAVRVNDYFQEISLDSIIKKSLDMFILFIIGLASWIIIELTHGIVVKMKKIK